MTTTARDLIVRALRLINAVGRGQRVSNAYLTTGLDHLRDIIASHSVSKSFQPGIRRHFFPLVGGQDVYSYGPGGDFDTNDFRDPAPVRIEDAYIRSGASISDNDLLTGGDFTGGASNSFPGWFPTAPGTSGFTAENAKLEIDLGANTLVALAQQVALTAGREYRLELDFELIGISTPTYIAEYLGYDLITLSSQRDIGLSTTPVIYERLTPSTSGLVTIDFTATVTSPWVGINGRFDSTDDGNNFQAAIDNVSLYDVGLPRKSLSGGGTDYPVKIISQDEYNAIYTKGDGGRAYRMLFSRTHPLAEVRLDNSSSEGEILVMDVTVEDSVDDINSNLYYPTQTTAWLKYRLAYELAPEFGKSFSRQQKDTLDEYYSRMIAGSKRDGDLVADPGLWHDNRSYNINRGEL